MASVIQNPSVVGQHTPMVAASLKASWRDACAELNLAPWGESSDIVSHDLNIWLVSNSDSSLRTQYSVSIDYPALPRFSVAKRATGQQVTEFRTGDDRFDAAVVVETDNRARLLQYLNRERRSIILQFLLRMPTARVTHDGVTAWSTGADHHQAKVATTVRRLVEVADYLRPSWVNVALDEQSVLHDLFDAGRDLDDIRYRFEDLYLGNSVSWTGEVVQVGEIDAVGQRAAVFIGTADGRTSETGRVIALTALDPALDVARGDVVTVAGFMRNLDPKKRFFRIE